MSQKNSDEIDLGLIFEKIKDMYHSFLVFLYGVFKFIVKSWIILLVLIIVGVVLGFLKDSPEKARETNLIVQINGDAVNYVYDAVEQLQAKIKEKDTVFLKNLGFYNNEVTFIGNVEIEPIVNVLDIIDQTVESNRNLEVIVEQAQYEDELLTSEIFIPEYKVHRIKLITHYWTNQGHIDRFLTYLNDNEALKASNEVLKNNLKYRIEENYKSIAYMDSIFELYGKPISEIKNKNQDQVSFFELNITNIHMLFQEKALLMEQNQKIELEFINFENTVELINRPLLSIKTSFFDNKKVIYPILFVFLFLAFSIARHFFKKAKKLSEERV
jgi:hypothetical protein